MEIGFFYRLVIQNMTKELLAGIIVFIAILAFAITIKPETTCKDGWRSPSIGQQGACSHHGGVDYNGEYVAVGLFGGLYAGWFVFLFLDNKREEKENEISRIEKQRFREINFPEEVKIEETILKAIGSNREIIFLYKKPKDKVYSQRNIVPKEIYHYWYPYGNSSTLCVKGHCKLRQAERSFALKRIKEIKIV